MPSEFNTRAFRDPTLVRQLIDDINQTSAVVAKKLGRPVQVMEVCGGHTHAIFHAGIEQLLSSDIEFVHGPGCPVCVLPKDAIDSAVTVAQQPDTILTSFGDVLRVPGSEMSLQQANAKGADVRILYSPFDAIELAKSNPDKRVVFFAIGFDTTMPSVAFTIQAAKRLGLTNLSFLCYHIRLMPTLTTLLEAKDVMLDGFVGPGHVSIVLGSDVYGPIAGKYGKPLVIAGFEPIDFLKALQMLMRQLSEGRCEIENAYERVVTRQGNRAARQAMREVFADSEMSWRGMGAIAESVGSLTPTYAAFDASIDLTTNIVTQDPEPAFCASVLIGQRKPDQCSHFCNGCSPDEPLGALMVSSEGACAAYYKYKHPDHQIETQEVPADA